MLEDWMEDLVDSRERIDFIPLTEFNISETDNLALLFNNPLNTPLTISYRIIKSNIFDTKTILTSVVLVFGLAFIKKDLST